MLRGCEWLTTRRLASLAWRGSAPLDNSALRQSLIHLGGYRRRSRGVRGGYAAAWVDVRPWTALGPRMSLSTARAWRWGDMITLSAVTLEGA
jgi:hypothetical protein